MMLLLSVLIEAPEDRLSNCTRPVAFRHKKHSIMSCDTKSPAFLVIADAGCSVSSTALLNVPGEQGMQKAFENQDG